MIHCIAKFREKTITFSLCPVCLCAHASAHVRLRVFNNLLTPNDHYSGHTAPLTSKRCILYIYSTNIGTKYFKHGIYSPFFFYSKCSLFRNSNVFGSCIIHILYTGCAKIKKNKSGAKSLIGSNHSIMWFVIRNLCCCSCSMYCPFSVMQEDFRCDGRKCLDYRPMEVETDVVSHASGSARIRLANTDILVGVKTEIDTPYPERPREGKIEFFVDWYGLLLFCFHT